MPRSRHFHTPHAGFLPLPGFLFLCGTLILSVIFSVLVCGFALWCQPYPFPDLLERFAQHPVLILLNLLPIWLFLLCLACIFCNLLTAAACTNLISGILSIVNRIKIQVRDEPLFPRDMALWKEAGSAFNSYHIEFPWDLITILVLSSLIPLIAGHFIRLFPHWNRKRCIPAAGCAGILSLLTVTLFASAPLYNDLTASVSIQEHLSAVFNENGFPYNFFHQFTTYQVDRPAGYSRTKAAAWDTADPSGTPDADSPGADNPDPSGAEIKDPDLSGTGIKDSNPSGRDETPANITVIFVMNEAFSDITDSSVFAFPPEDDPLYNLHAVRNDPHGIALRLIVPGFAGGTANTEFDICTGMQTNALGASTTSAMRTVNRNLDSIFRVFASDGYKTAFYHPGDNWFYNRENVYHWFGAQETCFIHQMNAPEYKGRWVTDNYFAGILEQAAQSAAAENTPLFLYATTIQNHMSYTPDKYGAGYAFPKVPLSVAVPEEVQSMLDVYTEGVRDADAMLGRLREYFTDSPEPVLLACFGDHLPYLGDNRLAYTALGLDAGTDNTGNPFASYETPCVVWANDTAAEVLDWENAVSMLDLPDNGRLSAAFFGAMVLELTGRRYANAWTAFLNELRRMAPVVQGELRMLADGTTVRAGDVPELEEKIQKWRQWSYYKLEQKTLHD